MMALLWEVAFRVVLPLILLMSLGYVARRTLRIQVDTLVSLNLYFFVPAYLLSRLTHEPISWRELGSIGLGTVAPIVLGSATFTVVLWLLRMPRQTLTGMVVASFFYNAGNIGVPVAELAFGAEGGRVQAIVVLFNSLMMFGVGYVIVALGQGADWRALGKVFRMPIPYVALVAAVLQWTELPLPVSLDRALTLLAGGMVPIALLTLGAQMAGQSGWPRWPPVLLVCLLKLVAMPLLAWGLVSAVGLWPSPGRLLVLAAAAPTAVNTLIVTLDLGGDSRFAADCVVWTTLLSTITIAAWLICLR